MYGLNPDGQRQFNTGVICATLSGVAILVRLYCKIAYKTGVHSDDYFMIVGYMFILISLACVLWGSITGGGGMEMKQLLMIASKDPRVFKKIEHYLQGLFLGYTFYLCAMFFIKISVLQFYRRIFFVKQTYRTASLWILFVIILWFVAAQVSNLATCIPIDSFWIRTKPGKCFNFSVMFLSIGIVETVIDAIILLLPIRMVFDLHLPRHTKIAVAGIFALGGFAIVTNCLRISYIYQPNTIFVNFAQAEFWSNIHGVTTIVCACLPICKTLWSTISKGTGTFISSFRSLIRSANTKSNSSSYVQMDNLRKGNSSLHSDTVNLKSSDQAAWTDIRDREATISVIGGEGGPPQDIPQGSIAYSQNIAVV